MNVAGVRSNVPAVLLDVSESETVDEPEATGVTVTFGVAPHEVNVTELGLTVATPVLLELTATTSVD